jgi:hypothetical protein
LLRKEGFWDHAEFVGWGERTRALMKGQRKSLMMLGGMRGRTKIFCKTLCAELELSV